MRVLIFGSKGQLGRDLVLVFDAEHEVLALDIDEIDIADRGAVEETAAKFAPELVINAAAYTDVDQAEEDEEAAFRVNEIGTAIVAQSASKHGAPVVYYSTDYVFGGTKSTPYKPGDAVAPIGVYARSKEAGERATSAAQPEHYILRTAWLYGPGGNNFVEKILALAADRPELRVVEDEVGSPTHTLDLAEATCALVTTGAYGLYHAVNRGQCSRFDFAREILRLAGSETRVVPCASSEFPTKAERPLYSVLDVEKLEQISGYSLPSWQEALSRYMQRR